MKQTALSRPVVSAVLVGLVAPLVITTLLLESAISAAAAPAPYIPPSMQTVLRDAVSQLAPYAKLRHIAVDVQVRGDSVINPAKLDTTRERVINLLANSIALAPENRHLQVTLTPDTLSVWITNKNVPVSVDRDVRDPHGNAFRLRSIVGQGTELSAHLEVLPVINTAARLP